MNVMTAAPTPAGELMEQVIVKGDLARLTPEERAKYYSAVCKSVGLNPMTRPFEYITLNGKLTLYARKDCTDQLRSLHNISVTELVETEREGVFVVTCKVVNAVGRADVAKGAVAIVGLKGEALANALMKAETKAKRRATLSICGLGMLDENEVEDIPPASKRRVVADAGNYPQHDSDGGVIEDLRAGSADRTTPPAAVETRITLGRHADAPPTPSNPTGGLPNDDVAPPVGADEESTRLMEIEQSLRLSADAGYTALRDHWNRMEPADQAFFKAMRDRTLIPRAREVDAGGPKSPTAPRARTDLLA